MSGLADKELVKKQYVSFSQYPVVLKQAIDDLLAVAEGKKDFETEAEPVSYIFYVFSYLFRVTKERLEDIKATQIDTKKNAHELKQDWHRRGKWNAKNWQQAITFPLTESKVKERYQKPVLADEYTKEAEHSLKQALLKNYSLKEIRKMHFYVRDMISDDVTGRLQELKYAAAEELTANRQDSHTSGAKKALERAFEITQIFLCLREALNAAFSEAEHKAVEKKSSKQVTNLLMNPALPFGISSSGSQRLVLKKHKRQISALDYNTRKRSVSDAVCSDINDEESDLLSRMNLSSIEEQFDAEDGEINNEKLDNFLEERPIQAIQESHIQAFDLYEEKTDSPIKKNQVNVLHVERWMEDLALTIEFVGYIGLLSALGLLGFIGITSLVGLGLLGFTGFLLLVLVGLRIYCEAQALTEIAPLKEQVLVRSHTEVKIKTKNWPITPPVYKSLISSHAQTLKELMVEVEQKPMGRRASQPVIQYRRLPASRKNNTPPATRSLEQKLQINKSSRNFRRLITGIDMESSSRSTVSSPSPVSSVSSISPLSPHFDSPIRGGGRQFPRKSNFQKSRSEARLPSVSRVDHG